MCRVLNIPRSLVYYKRKIRVCNTKLENAIISIFRESKNNIIDEILETFEIQRSLSKKGCPYDNAVAEAGYKIIKTEFAFNRIFNSLEELKLELRSYVLWYNNKRIHSSLNYMTPVEYRLANMTE
ncbi:IS3 family transposase [Clostridiaceae bacterium WCA-383-APC-5B]|uniref:IS3 family transposase n=1 Tax=Inconstantimicrobium porci TaxID=2652291 RepID=A0A7X2MZK8_9CLOT|nr:IS3 family transposase [Inconstantimicrobium porci]MSR91992.1 IS3 family transposase [Inconstantimicrobium porci]MSR92007.1 IS3 family transposase [Inconstantimicrobium porci]